MSPSIHNRIKQLIRDQKVESFRERMTLQIRVIKSLAVDHYAGDVLKATEDIAPEFAVLVDKGI